MKTLLLSAATLAFCATTASAKVWRINNNAGASADFNDLTAAYSSASVVAGDTLHLEPSATQYNLSSISKNTVVIGPGYLLNSSANGNAGLQADVREAKIGFFGFAAGGAGTRLIGVTLASSFTTTSTTFNLTFEKCKIETNILNNIPAGTYTGLVIRKCFISGQIASSVASFNGLVVENCIFAGDAGGFSNGVALTNPSGTNCIFRNNVVRTLFAATVANCYVANNIFINNGSGTNNVFTGSNVKNNLFNSTGQSFPVGATANQTGITEAATFVGTGSSDARFMLKAGSPAIAAGVTVGSVVTPDAGAYGGPDPYKLSGIPAVPTIYSITVPASIPQGQSTMNVTFSTRSNN